MAEPLVLSSAQARAIDRHAIERLGLPACVLMENAGRGAAERLLAELRRETFGGARRPPPWRVLVLCGRGGNGGDGYVLARHVFLAGHQVQIVSTHRTRELTPEAALFRRVCEQLGIAMHDAGGLDAQVLARASEFDALVDALLGVGASGALRAPLPEWIGRFNAASGPLKLALDLPSGLDADRGPCGEPCARADLTVTFAAFKRGLLAPGAAEFTGRICVEGIGAPVAGDGVRFE